MVWEIVLHRRRYINHVTCQFLSVFGCFWTWLEGCSGQPACSGLGCSSSRTVPSPSLASSPPRTWYDLTLLTQDCVALQGSGSEIDAGLMLPGAQHRGPHREYLPGTASQKEVHLCSFGRSPVTYLKPQTPMTNYSLAQDRHPLSADWILIWCFANRSAHLRAESSSAKGASGRWIIVNFHLIHFLQ